jgi:transcriptional regulator
VRTRRSQRSSRGSPRRRERSTSRRGAFTPCTSTGECARLSCRSGKGEGLGDHIELPQGTLELLILKTLALEPRHGWAISERLHQISSATLQVRQGSIYPALHRLERRGWIKAEWGASTNNRRAKYYALTKRGRAQLNADIASWRKLAAAIAQVIDEV